MAQLRSHSISSPSKKIITQFSDPWQPVQVTPCLGCLPFGKEKRQNHQSPQKQTGAMSACENSAICSWANSSKKDIKVNIRGTSAYSPSPRLHTQQLYPGNECSTWKQRFLSGRGGWACFWWRLITEEVIKAIGGTRDAADMGEKANIKGMKEIIKQSWKDVKKLIRKPNMTEWEEQLTGWIKTIKDLF